MRGVDRAGGRAGRLAPALVGALVAAWAGGCDSGPAPLLLLAVEPDIGADASPTPVTLRGTFHAPVETDLTTGRGVLREGFSAWVGETPMEEVALVSSGELEAVVPRGLAPGRYPVSVEDPLGRRARLEAAFLVVADDGAGPRVEILQPGDEARAPAGGAFIVRYRATERQPARISRVDYAVEVGRASERNYLLEEPASAVEGFFVVEVPVFPEERRVQVEVIAWDDAPNPSHGGARVDVLIDNCSDDRDCDDGQFCDGRERCEDGWCRTAEAVACEDPFECTDDSCDEEADLCLHLPRDELCDDGLACTGVEVCTVEAGCVAEAPPCADGIDCTLDLCDEETLECWNAPVDSRCDDGLFCDGAEVCDPSSGCRSGVPPCQDGIECTVDQCNEASESCSNLPEDSLCSDGDRCTADLCEPREGCTSRPGVEGPVGTPSCADGLDSDCDLLLDGADPGCAGPACMDLRVLSAGPLAATVEVDLCEPRRDPALLHCESARNEAALASWDFESGTSGVDLAGDVTPSAAAQAWLSPGARGLRLCGGGASVEASVDTRGARGLALRLAAGSESLADGEYLEVLVSPDGGDAIQLLVLGDGAAGPPRRRMLVLPSEADGRSHLRVRVAVVGVDGCGLLDDLAVVDLPSASASRDLLSESFDAGFGDLVVVDPSGRDVARVPGALGWAAQLTGGSGAWLGAFLKEPLAGPEQGLVLTVRLEAVGLGPDAYGLVQCSLDRGASWVDLLGVGLDRSLSPAPLVGGILDLLEGAPEAVWLRVVAPTAAVGGGLLLVDDLSVRAVDPVLVDEIGPFVDLGDGTYRASLEAAAPGETTVRCVYRTSGYALWSAPVALSL